MNIEKHLILIKGEDKTESISSCVDDNRKWKVEYAKGKSYPYSYENVQWLKNPITHPPSETVVFHNNHPLSNVSNIYDFGDYIRIRFANGRTKAYSRQELSLEKNCINNLVAHNSFEYLKQLAAKVGITNEDDSGFLYKQYEKLTVVSSGSVLSRYLDPVEMNNTQIGQKPIFPFGYNLSQKTATEKAMTEQISVIEGPPGTGKTQTILNIIANAVINGKTVAVVSNNNAATANVSEKLQKYGVDFISAYLGNTSNKEKHFAEQTKTYPNMSDWVMDTSKYTTMKESLDVSGEKLKEMLEAKNKLATLNQELKTLLVEKEYFHTYYNESNEGVVPYRSLYKQNSASAMALWIEYQRMAEHDITATLSFKVKNLLRHGIYSFQFYTNSNEKIIGYLQKLYYECKTKELTREINTLTKKLERFKFDSAMKEYSSNSMTLFKAKLAQRYSNRQERKLFTKDSLWRDFGSFINEYPVILSTTHSLRSCASNNYLFDYVIMDEASQIDIVTGGLALSCARNAIIVGDLKQLPNVVTREIAEETDPIFGRFGLNGAYHYAENSILSSITKLYPNIPKTLLKEHYRCHPKIIGFCNQKFYNNELIILTEEKGRDKPLVVYKTAKGNHARGKYNQRQIDVILEEIIPEQIDATQKQTVGIISPYRLQKDKLKEAIGNQDIEVDTVHKYQGREKDVVILTTVVNEVNEFVDNPNLINVAVSRAVDKLIVVVSDNENNDNSNIGDLVKYIEYNNFEVISSSIYSVFDKLYHSYSDQLLATMKKRKKVSDYESENLMNAVIDKVLRLPQFQGLDKVMHQPLKMLIRDLVKLEENECKFAMNILTHTDFVIYNKINKMPVLVVEVDGYAFHSNNPKQLKRDKMKDSILQKYGIPIIRMGTDESGEETRLRNTLMNIFKAS